MKTNRAKEIAQAKKAATLIKTIEANLILGKALLADGLHCAIYDACPTGYYRNGSDGPQFLQGGYRALADSSKSLNSTKEVELLVAELFIAAAKHCHRYLYVDEADLAHTLTRIDYDHEYRKEYVGKSLQTRPTATYATVLPPNVCVLVTAYAHDLGRLARESYGSSMVHYTAMLLKPNAITVLEIVPKVSMHRAAVSV